MASEDPDQGVSEDERARVARRSARQETRRQLILDAAAEEFAVSGFDGATLEHIGERVGLSKASLYYYVTGKEDLFAALLGRFVDDIEDRVLESIGEGADAVEALSVVVAGHLGTTESVFSRVLAENLHVIRQGPAREQAARYERIVSGILESGMAAGRIREMPVRPAVKLLIGAMNGVSQWFDHNGSLSLDEVSEGLVGVFLRGVEQRD